MLHALLLLAHLLAAIVWIGGMFFAHFCLRPAAVRVLQPPQRLPLMAATFARFLPVVAVAVVVLLATGAALMAPVGLAGAPVGWHVMLGLGVVMAAVFARIGLGHYPRLRDRCATADWPAAAEALAGMRRLVTVNLVLGTLTVVAALSARF